MNAGGARDEPTWCRGLPWNLQSPVQPQLRRRRCHWLARRPRGFLQKRLRRRSGYRGTRVGEASHPGPPPPSGIQARQHSPSRDEPPTQRRRMLCGAAPVRCFCPVPGCQLGDPHLGRGWTGHDSMRLHLDEHCAGTLEGSVPAEYLAALGSVPRPLCGARC